MKRLILAFDIGTTYSGASYGITDGTKKSKQELKVNNVTRFTGHSAVGENARIPSQILYDDITGVTVRVGAEVDDLEKNPSDAAVALWNKCTKVEWFKMLLRPNRMILPYGLACQLPAEKTGVQVFADFLKYLYQQTCQFIEQTDRQADLLLKAQDTTQKPRIVITHPNGWEAYQQQLIRKAAKEAELIDNEHDKRLVLLTEGEAAAHYCFARGSMDDILEKGDGIVVIDAGGGTIDISSYGKSALSTKNNLRLEEIAPSKCLLHGSVFVTRSAEAYVKRKLKGTHYEDQIPNIVKIFDEDTKRSFSGPKKDSPCYVTFARGFKKQSDDDDPADVRNGSFIIPDDQMVEFFKPSIMAIVQAIIEIKKEAQVPIKCVLLVGGFAANDWLYYQVLDHLEPLQIQLYRPDRHTSKAVADGAIYFCSNRRVKSRVAKFTYGVEIRVPYDPTREDHKVRKDTAIICEADGKRYLHNVFLPILTKGTQVEETTTKFRYQFCLSISSEKTLENKLKDQIICYTGACSGSDHQFMDAERENYKPVLTYESKLTNEIIEDFDNFPRHLSEFDMGYIIFPYDIILYFGLTEFEAQTVVCYQKPGAKEGTTVEVKFTPHTIYHE